MKELSIEEKAKAYDEALERARKLKENPQSVFNEYSPKEGDTICDYIFPELKESEDERIRKELITHCRNTRCVTVTEEGAERIAKWIAWLEKQGGQKSTDKSGPKFKVGDWVISTLPGIKYPHLITDIQDGYYIFGEDDEHAHITSNDDIFKLWTIADAKDGDVLMSRSPFIYGKQCPYGGLNWSNNNFIKASNFIFTDSPVHPATKEQCDLLFKKMKEAGYGWDAEKKKLLSKPIKYNSNPPSIDKKSDWSEEDEEYNGEDYGIDSLYHAQRILEKTLGKVDGYQTDDGILSHKCAITTVKKLYEQKPTEWSKEDKAELVNTIIMLKEGASLHFCKKDITKAVDWLQSLRPQSKQEWSEDDEVYLNTTIAYLKDAQEFKKTAENCIGWLKSLKQRIKGE